MMTPTSSHYIITTDVQVAENELRAQQAPAEQAIAVMGSLLENADSFVAELESNEMLGSAIVRSCQDLAELVGNLATEMEQQTDQDKQAMAKACLEDVTNAAAAVAQEQQQQMVTASTQEQQLSTLSEQDILSALSGAQALLRDVEASLRSITGNEADEIADVALTVARLTILSLKDVHSTLTPEQLMLATTNSRDLQASDRIEIIDNGDGTTGENDESRKVGAPKRSTTARKDRMRALWPPLGPAVASAAQWGKQEAANKPLLAVALGLTLWPAAICTALMGAPVVLLDGVLQEFYNAGGPLVDTVERGAAHLYHASRLTLLCSGLVARQSVRVAKRQVERQGGIEVIAGNVGHAVLDRVTHPVETVQMAWGALCMGVGAVQEGIQFVQEAVERQQEEAKAEIIR